MRRYLVPLVFALLLSGCTTTLYSWQNPGQPDPQALEEAERSCALLADDELYRFGYPNPFYYYGIYSWAPGWPYLYGDPYGGGFSYYGEPYAAAPQQLFRVCMKAKGWRLVPVNPAEPAG